MNWFYAYNGQRAGPVEDDEFGRLVATGVVTAATLVWHSGMPDWMPFAQARATAPSAGMPVGSSLGDPVAGGAYQAQCSQCGRVFASDHVIRLEGFNVCAECKPILLQKIRQGISPAVGAWGVPMVRFGGFWIRCGASFLDFLMMLPISLGLMFGAIYFYPDILIFDLNKDLSPQLIYRGVSFALGLAYDVFFTGKFGGTPGKLICGLRVVRPDGSKITYARALGRYFAKLVSSFTLLIGYIIAAFDQQKRALHDYMADTRVVCKN